MNELSWLIYLAGVVENLASVFLILGFALLAFFVIKLVVQLYDYSLSDKEKSQAWFKFQLSLPIITILWLLACLMPAKETVYAIAASEIGDKVIHSPTGSLAEQAFDVWLKKQIKTDKDQ